MRGRFVVCTVAVLALLSARAAIPQDNGSTAVRAAVTKSLALLESSGHTWIEKTGCISCHHQSLPAVSFALAKTRGFARDIGMTRERVETAIGRWAGQREALFQANTGPINGGVVSAGYTLLGLAADDVAPNTTTDAMAHYIAARQLSDGRFRGPNQNRPPLEHSDVTATAIAIRTLQLYAPPGRKDQMTRVIRRAQDWLVSTPPHGTEEKSFQLQGLRWASAEKRQIARRAATLLSEQRPDGGWAQLPTLSSDAYATGQALVALHQAGGLPTTSSAYRHGIQFLLKTQLTDGSWLVTSRGRGSQPYVESGFPHGTNQFISAAGTAWATSALLLSLEPAAAPQRR